MTRTTKIVLGAVGILILIGIALWITFRPSDPSAPENDAGLFRFFSGGGAFSSSSAEPAVIAETQESPRLKQIVKDPMIGAALTHDESAIMYYQLQGGNLFRLNFASEQPERISNITIVGITQVRWSAKRDFAAVSYLESDRAKFFVSSVGTSSQALFLPATVSSFQWGGGSTLYYTEAVSSGSRLVTSTAGKNPKTLATNVIPDLRLTGANAAGIVWESAPTAAVAGISQLISPGGNTVELVSRLGLQILPGPGRTFLISGLTSEGRLDGLALYDERGTLLRSFNVATFSEKCAFGRTATSLYCAVPDNAAGTLPDHWFQGKINFRDHIVHVDLETGITAEVLPSTTFDAIELFIDSKEQYLFFTNKNDSTLWRVELPKKP